MIWSNDLQDATWTPCDARAGIVRAPHGNLRCFSYSMGHARGPSGTHKCVVCHPYGLVRKMTQPEFAKIPLGSRMWPYGTSTGPCGPRMGGSRAVHGMFTISQAYNACIWTLRAPFGKAKFVWRARGRKGPMNGRMMAHGVWCDWGITEAHMHHSFNPLRPRDAYIHW